MERLFATITAVVLSAAFLCLGGTTCKAGIINIGTSTISARWLRQKSQIEDRMLEVEIRTISVPYAKEYFILANSKENLYLYIYPWSENNRKTAKIINSSQADRNWQFVCHYTRGSLFKTFHSEILAHINLADLANTPD